MKNFAEKTIRDIQNIFGDLFYTEEIARKKGLLQHLDPRVKLLTVLILIIAINCTKTISSTAIIVGYIIILAALSKVQMFRYLCRVFVLAIIFSGLIVLPSIFNIYQAGAPLLLITKHFYITKNGTYSAGLLLLRTFGSVSLIYIFTTTTKWADILKSLATIKISTLLITTLSMTQRYIFLGLELASNLFTAKKSRSLRKCSGKSGRRFIATTTGNLFIRTSVQSEEVYQAMLARGYTGEAKTLSNFCVGTADYAWIFFNLILLAGFWH